MKNILRHFQKNLILSLAVIGCVGMYSTNLMMDAIALSADPGESPGVVDSDESEELYDFETDLIIYAINPGYTQTTDTGKLSDVGEFIELLNLTDAPLALAGYAIIYTNGSGNDSTLFTFPEGSVMTGKHLLLRYYKSPEAVEADLNYHSSLALKAGLKLVYADEIVDQVCWNGQTGCKSTFTSSNPKVLLRDLFDGSFAQVKVAEYEPEYRADEVRLIMPDGPDEDDEETGADMEGTGPPHCQGLQFSELLTYYYAEDKSEQFIEFFNSTTDDIVLDGCKISFKNKLYELSGTVGAGTYLAYYQSEQFALTKNPTNPLTLTLLDTDGSVVDEVAYPNGQKKSTTYARIFDAEGRESWNVTYAPTPNAENVYQKFRSCEEGKIINEATGNCVKVTTLTTTPTLAACPEGQYRNPLTNRCKKIETDSTSLKECAEGYERNPETNRCRKVTTPNDGADYALVPNTGTSHTVFIGVGIVLLIIVLGVVYVILQFRHEIGRAARKAGQSLNRIGKDLLARTIGRHRDKEP